VLVEPRAQPLDVPGPAVRVPDRVQLERVVRHFESAEDLVVELEHLGVDRGIGAADRLDAQLPVLAVAALLRPVVTPERPDRVELLRLRLAMEPVLDVGARDRRGALGPQGQRASAAVLERVRLLLDDVRPLARRADDQVGILDPRRLDRPVAVEAADLLHRRRHPTPAGLLGREDVVGAARRLERRRHVRRSARYGLRASSAPSVVGAP
jgi:hypothetical protein